MVACGIPKGSRARMAFADRPSDGWMRGPPLLGWDRARAFHGSAANDNGRRPPLTFENGLWRQPHGRSLLNPLLRSQTFT